VKNVFILLILITVIACNPVKRAFKPKFIEDTKVEFFTRKLCINDTEVVTKTIHDSTIIKDSTIVIEYINQKFNFVLDTTVNGARLSINHGRVQISYPEKVQVKYHTTTVTNTVRDKGLESVLEKRIHDKDSTITALSQDLKETKACARKYKFNFYGLVALIIALLAYRAFRIIRP